MISETFRNLILCLFLTVGCTGKSIHDSQVFPEYDYNSISEWESIQQITMNVETWYSSKDNEAIYLPQPRGIVQVSQDKFWVSDVMVSGIYEFNSKGEYSHQVIGKGKGPKEVMRPFAMAAYHSNENDYIYVLDGDQQSILKLDEFGNELTRVYTPSVSNKAMTDYPIIIDENSLIWHTFNREDYTLSEWDSTGHFKKGWVKRIIPLGEQPEMLNAVLYDICAETGTFSYVYRGLPLVFFHNKNEKTVININPEVNLEKIISRKSRDEFNSVSTIIKGIAFQDDYIYTGIDNILTVIPVNKNEPIKKLTLINENGEPIIYHFMNKVNKSIFFIDGYNSIIYRMNL